MAPHKPSLQTLVDIKWREQKSVFNCQVEKKESLAKSLNRLPLLTRLEEIGDTIMCFMGNINVRALFDA